MHVAASELGSTRVSPFPPSYSELDRGEGSAGDLDEKAKDGKEDWEMA